MSLPALRPIPGGAPRPAPAADWLTGYLMMLRDSLERLLHAYRHIAETSAAGAPPDALAVACIGLRLDPVPGNIRQARPPGCSATWACPRDAAAIIASAWWSAADPQLSIAFGWVHDDVARRYPSLAALRLLLEPYGLRIPLALPTDSGPVADGWLRPVTDAEAPVRLTATAALLLDGWRPPAEPGADLPDRLRAPAEQAAALLSQGHRVVVLRCAEDAAIRN